jgi:hypothetical protein
VPSTSPARLAQNANRVNLEGLPIGFDYCWLEPVHLSPITLSTVRPIDESDAQNFAGESTRAGPLSRMDLAPRSMIFGSPASKGERAHFTHSGRPDDPYQVIAICRVWT